MRATVLTALVLMCLVAAPSVAGLNVVVVLDDSGSMDERMRKNRRVRKMDAAKEALVSVLETLPTDAQIGILLLNGKRNADPWVIPLGPVDMPQVRQTMQKVRAYGGTPLGQYMKLAADQLLQLREQQHYGSYRLLIVTDGEATDRQLVDRYLPDVLSRGITVDVIGVDMTANHSLATRVHSYRRADDPQSLSQALAEVFAESSDSGGAMDASDFELLAGFPDETAEAALKALGEMGDQPIGQSAANQLETSSGQPPAAASPAARPPRAPGNQNANRPQKRRSVATNLITTCMCMGFLVLWFVISRSGSRRRRQP